MTARCRRAGRRRAAGRGWRRGRRACCAARRGSTRLTIVPVAAPGTVRSAEPTPAAVSSATRPGAGGVVADAAGQQHRHAEPGQVHGDVRARPRRRGCGWTPAGPSPGAGSPERTATTSVATSPTTTTGARRGRRRHRRQRRGDPAGQLGVAQHQPHVDRQGRAVAGPVQVVEHERASPPCRGPRPSSAAASASAMTRSCRAGSSCSSAGSGLATTTAPGASARRAAKTAAACSGSSTAQSSVEPESAT